MSHEQEFTAVSFDKIIEDFAKCNETSDNLDASRITVGNSDLSPSESALTEFREEYAKRIREAFCDGNDP